ncbi:HAMP domain-containing protein [Leptospira gomenensis]|uniref:HAMP domain-containing protein n=1 Tax=Leptospira gomenensis TaxID=2484974 RepID=A0A5F1Z173_9LEPT|nr:SpoIIE family protein phosphatase [Leptospira gomenensis]TGK33426.1 HAMP domain-containing protein [Leptospira gomenensis]TGK40948.1 HAMP domain-containing protein [Leptospira gomenensis]TGK46382.1 HAMP domain-containing protein [Leptospira gomenensis]TGK67482.1 HAMP domain-containing protein [Leptospira gomenensis]
MIPDKYLRMILPGIRAKLSFFTAVLVISLLTITSVIYYNQQQKSLEEKMNTELKAPLEYVNAVVSDLEKLSYSLILIEEFKIRVKEKKKELGKFKRKVIKKEGGLFGALKSFGASIGLKVKHNYYQKSVDTYFTRYLSENEIRDFEIKVRGELRRENGTPIDPLYYDKLMNISRRTALARIEAENARYRIAEADEEIKTLESEISSLSDPKRRKELISEKETLSSEKESLVKYVSESEKKSALGETALTKNLQNFFRGSYKDKISSLGLLPDKIRILAYDTSGKQTLDTGLLFPESSETGKKLLSTASFEENKKGLFRGDDPFRVMREFRDPENYEIAGRQYEVSYRVVFRNPGIAERSETLIDEVLKNPNRWKQYLDTDRKFASDLGELSQKIKSKVGELKKVGKIKPASDPEFRSLYSQYKKIIKLRDSKLDELNPYSEEIARMELDRKKEISLLQSKLRSLNEELLVWKKKEKMPVKEVEANFSPEDIQENIRSLEANAEEIREILERAEATQFDWSDSIFFRAPASFVGLREAALDEFVFLPYRSDFNSMRRFWRNSEERKTVKKKWALLRDWIFAGNSETELPKSAIPVLDSGILIRSRSEAEEWMWALDSSPLFSESEVKEASGLARDLLRKNHLGFNVVILDRTDGLRKIRQNREELLRYTALLGFVAILFAYVLAWMVARRIKTIISRTEEVGKGNLNVEFPPSGYDEIGILSDSLNRMTQGLKEREEMKGELLAAEEIQKRLLPEKLPNDPGDAVEFGAFYKAMAGVGGDYYDFIELNKNEVALCVGDVSSHGVGPAIVMSLFRAQVRAILRKGERDLRKILTELNEYLYSDTPDHIFVTFFMAIYDRSAFKMRYISAGHVKPLLYDASEKKIRELPAGGLPIGMDENSFFETTIEARSFLMDAGDIFFQYTDGLDEARSPQGAMYGKDRLAKTILTNAHDSPSEIIRTVVEDLDVHTGKNLGGPGFSELSDDIAMIAMKRKS